MCVMLFSLVCPYNVSLTGSHLASVNNFCHNIVVSCHNSVLYPSR